MNADKYLESIGLENVIDEEFFNNDDKSWYKVQELMESYHQAKLKLLDIPAVSKSFTAEEVVNELEDCDTLDDAIMFFKEQMQQYMFANMCSADVETHTKLN